MHKLYSKTGFRDNTNTPSSIKTVYFSEKLQSFTFDKEYDKKSLDNDYNMKLNAELSYYEGTYI